jgi:RHS repeat-associated protein
MGVDIVGEDGGGGLTPGDGQIERWDQIKTGGDWTLRAASSTEGGTSSQITMSYDVPSSRERGYVAAVFRALQSDYPTPTPTATPAATPTSTPETGWESAYYVYSSSHPHAVSTVQHDGGDDNFDYDNAGNMTSRSEAGTSWTQYFDEEGRLVEIINGANTWGFVYDGDGIRVMQENPDGTTTLFLGGGSYEVHIDGETTTVKKYYAAGGQRVMRDGDGLHYLLTDHLGSVVGVLDGNGSIETDERYLPFGGLRDTSRIAETDFAFTGQRNLSSVGLMDYNARWYSPSLKRFISPDSLVAQPSNPQALNRYAYVTNNPLRYTDPSGHFCVEVGGNIICSEDDDDSNMYWWPSISPSTVADSSDLTEGSGIVNTKPYGGVELKALYEKMKAYESGWWYNDSYFTFEEFMGLLIIHEGAGISGPEEWVAKLAAQQVYVGGWTAPYCDLGMCFNGALNFWAAYSGSVWGLIDTYVRGERPIQQYLGYQDKGFVNPVKTMSRAAKLGNMMLHPAELWPNSYDSPTQWGNDPDLTEALRAARIEEGVFLSTAYDSVVYYFETFVVLTINQYNSWKK